jgi:hypothetical protein
LTRTRGTFRRKRDEVIEENGELRERLGMEHDLTFERWESSMPQEVRDTFAARALVNEMGNCAAALTRLGFPRHDPKKFPNYRETWAKVFQTPGVLKILNLGKLEDFQEPIMFRQAEVALHGDDTNSTRAAQFVARTLGWQKTPDIHIHQNRQTIYALVNQKNSRGEIEGETIEALADDFLGHEPAGPQRIDSGDERVLAALNPGMDADSGDEDDNS